jgi:translation initiation factor IF-1
MVKNTSGGTKTKGLARKHQVGAAGGGGGGGGPLRIPNNPLEQLVVVTKMLGNGMCEVFNNDDLRFIAHIRNKFKGRNRRSNDISVNSVILVGLREWEKPAKNADVIFVYDLNDYHALQSIPYLHSHKLFDRIYSNHNINLLNHLVDFTIDSLPIDSNHSNHSNHSLPFDFNLNDI